MTVWGQGSRGTQREAGTLAALREHDHRLTRRIAAWDSPWALRLLPPVEDAAKHTKVWWAAAVAMTALGGPRGRRAAAAGIAAMALAELLSDQVAKKLVERPRPPKEWIPRGDAEDRPDSSSFPSGHTAAAVAFTTAVASAWPGAGAACAVPALMVALERIHSGAHYPSDVAAGAAIGLACAGLARSAAGPVWRRLP
ncbi:phosphatase PAP2 family protein [Streptomyces sp. NPDC058655]|uniref:phosphatase PAP2 family protein n=1 Tax=unclassified Streptomyces TaxID=2593676 RepID=UPI0036692D64